MTNFKLGQQVTNFGITATVVGFHKASGSLILEAPGTGRWLADPAKTQVATTPLMHRDGLIAIG